MPFDIELLPEPPAIYVILSHDFDVDTEILDTSERIKGLLDAVITPVFFILDFEAFVYPLDKFLEFQEFTFGKSDNIFYTNLRTGTMQVMKHPNTRETLMITKNPVLTFGVRGMNTPAFGNIPIRVFSSLNNALDYAKSKPLL